VKDRPNGQQILATALVLVLALSWIAVVSGLLFTASSDVTRWIVRGVAWIKGVPLDTELYGLPRSTLWENQLRRFGSALSEWGALAGLCVTIVMILRSLREPWTTVLRGVVFFAGFSLALYVRTTITLPFSNPLGVVGPLEQLRQNPLDNALRFLLAVIIPVVAVLLFNRLLGKERPLASSSAISTVTIPPVPRLLAILLTVGLVVLVAGEVYTWHEQVPLDTFHEGESLGPAVHWEHGQAPYKDFVIIHGPFQDPLRSVLAFGLFGRSIAASRTLESLLEIAALCLFALMVLHLFEWDPGTGSLALAGLFIFISSKPFAAGFTLPHRDIALYLFLLAMVTLYRLLRRIDGTLQKARIHGLFFISSAIPLASFAYSADRGLYLTLGGVLMISLLYWLFVKRFEASYVAAIVGGAAVGVSCLGLSIRWAFPEFLSHVFAMLPRVQALGFFLPYPFDNATGIVPLVLTAFNASWLAGRLVARCRSIRALREGVREFARNDFVEILLFILGGLFYATALGRAGSVHIYYSGGLIFLLTSLILIRHIGGRALAVLSARHGLRFGVGLVLVSATAMLYVIAGIHTAQWFRFPLGAPDDDAIGSNYQNAIAFLRDSLSEDSHFLTLTSEGVWEYFIGKPSPTRFPIVVYAMPVRYQEELNTEMDLRRIEYVLYRNKHWANAIDNIPLEKRLPRVVRYVQENYEPYRMFDDQELWRRRQKHGIQEDAPEGRYGRR